MIKYFILILIMCTLGQKAQTAKLVEEIAFFHLDSLIRVDTNCRVLKYIFNGYIDKRKTNFWDTLLVTGKKDSYHLKSAFKNLTVLEDSTVRRFDVPNKKRRHGTADPLTLYRHLKANGLYYVMFDIEHFNGGQFVLLVLDASGNLIRRNVGSYIH